MSDAYTTRNRARKIEAGTRPNTWGPVLNDEVFQLFDDALDGWLNLSANTALTSANGSTDQARKRMIKATAAITITIPSVEKWYWVWASSGDVVVTNGSNSVTVLSGNVAAVLTDGTAISLGVLYDFGATVPKSSGTPTTDYHLTNKAWVSAQIAAASFSPGGAGTDGQFLKTVGTAITWSDITTADIAGLDTTLDSYYTKTAADARYYTQSQVDTALALKANLASPTFTGTPLAPTASVGTNTTQIATTAFVQAASKTKAFCAFECSTGIRVSQSNVSLIVRNGAGDYSVTFSSALPSLGYGVTFGHETGVSTGLVVRVRGSSRATSGFRIDCTTPAGTAADADFISFSVMQ